MASATLTEIAPQASNGKPASPTVEAVVRYAERLRHQADPEAKGWWPTTARALHRYERELVEVRLAYGIADDGSEDDEQIRGAAARRTIEWMKRRVARDQDQAASADSEAPERDGRPRRKRSHEERDRRAGATRTLVAGAAGVRTALATRRSTLAFPAANAAFAVAQRVLGG